MDAAGYCSGLGPHPYGTWLTSSLPQGLYNQTMEAMDHMLQCFMMQNPTTNELYFLLSVRAAGSGAGSGVWGGGRSRDAQLWPESPREGPPQDARPGQ